MGFRLKKFWCNFFKILVIFFSQKIGKNTPKFLELKKNIPDMITYGNIFLVISQKFRETEKFNIDFLAQKFFLGSIHV